MKSYCVVVLLGAVALLSACSGRSISDPYGRSRNPDYVGELTELDVIGIDPAVAVTEAEIGAAAAEGGSAGLRDGDRVLLVQSGAATPDAGMVAALSEHYRVSPFSGLPQPKAGENTSRVLRLAAARGGNRAILCYWGTIEVGKEDMGSKTVSWLPIVGQIIPDETQLMRVGLRVILLDVPSGRWAGVSVTGEQDRASSAGFSRESSDVSQVDRMKARAYEQLARAIRARFGS